jgi:hypothetical protein
LLHAWSSHKGELTVKDWHKNCKAPQKEVWKRAKKGFFSQNDTTSLQSGERRGITEFVASQKDPASPRDR